jgi:DNA polymerase I-like protein with 3'-5' exonuclease and polymerase domains/uracil-DNA glycosylase
MIAAQRTGIRFQHYIRGPLSAPIMFVCDPPKLEAHRAQMPTDMDALRRIAQAAVPVGFGKADFVFVGLCPPMPEDAVDSASRKWAHVESHVETLWEVIRHANPKCVVPLGELASRAVLGRAVAITKSRGQAVEKDGLLVMPMLSPAFVNRVPEHAPTFTADMLTLAKLRDNGYRPLEAERLDYRWCTDIQFLLDEPPEVIGLDTETTGLSWYDDQTHVITVQISWARGQAVAVPVDPVYWPEWQGAGRQRAKLVGQLKALLENPAVKKTGHNLKFDVQMLSKLGINLRGWTDDTQLLAFALDENMMQKSLDECVRRWVPEMAGYADEFNREVDKSNMRAVPRDKMLTYSCGDADAALRLFHTTHDMLRRDRQQYNLYRRIMMPAIQTFCDRVERQGMLVDQERLRSFEVEVAQWVTQSYDDLIRKVPPLVRRKHMEVKNGLAFSRPSFVKDILFTREGFNLTPTVYTKSTRKLPLDQREPSTSTKDHLPYFADQQDDAGEFVRGLIDHQKTEKLLGTYIKGFYKYIGEDGRIHPSYKLHGTNTGRTASDNPNGQNFPKRGRWAKSYQKIFTPTPGFRLVNCDLSQIELRIAAWMANERRMLEIYREDGDIHTATAQAVSRMTDAQWNALSRGEKKSLRTKAKACIAEGQLVLTSNGLKPIEKVDIKDLVWDGVEWVRHEGLIYQGYKEVIEYDGLIATPDHIVWTKDGRQVPFGVAASEVEGPGLAIGEIAGVAVGFAGDQRDGDYSGFAQESGDNLQFLRSGSQIARGQSVVGQDNRLSLQAGGQVGFDPWQSLLGRTGRSLGRAIRRHQAKVLQSILRVVSAVWGPGDRTALCGAGSIHPLVLGEHSARDLSWGADRPDQQRRALRAGEPAAGLAGGQLAQQANFKAGRVSGDDGERFRPVASPKDRFSGVRDVTDAHLEAGGVGCSVAGNSDKKALRFAHVYDLKNCGPRHRFTVSGRVVHNCNFGFLYGMGWFKFMGYAKTDYGVTYTEKEAQQTRDLFFTTYAGLPNWHDAMREQAHRHGFVRALHGARRNLPSIYSKDPIIVGGAERQAINAPVQRFGSDLGLTALIRFSHCADPDLYRIIGFVHDALVMEVREGYEREGISALLYAMESCPFEDWFGITPPLPIKADAEIGMNGGELFELADLPDDLPDWLTALDPRSIAPERPNWWQEIEIDTNPHRVELYRA